jgi:hypothetical protein
MCGYDLPLQKFRVSLGEERVGVLGHSMLGTVWSTEIPAFFYQRLLELL